MEMEGWVSGEGLSVRRIAGCGDTGAAPGVAAGPGDAKELRAWEETWVMLRSTRWEGAGRRRKRVTSQCRVSRECDGQGV